MEAKYGSLVRGVLASQAKAPAGPRGPLFRTLKHGLGSLVDALAARVPITHTTVEAIERGSGQTRFRVRAGGNWIDADHVVVACPAWAASALVSNLDGRLAERKLSGPHSSVQPSATRVSITPPARPCFSRMVQSAPERVRS